MKSGLYLDYHASTPVDAEVCEAMQPFYTAKCGNPATDHWSGKEARKALNEAREQVASAVGSAFEEVIFTSGATESNNLAIKGLAEAQAAKGRHIISFAAEHKSVLAPCAYLESRGFEFTILGVDRNGRVDPQELLAHLRMGAVGTKDRTILVSLMHANNEVGTLQPVKEVGQILQDKAIAFHVDAAQTLGREWLHAGQMGIDLLSISGHKAYGPKGIGALVLRKGPKNLDLVPQIHGGGQECGMRSGTSPVPLIVGLGRACELAYQRREEDHQRILALKKRLEKRLSSLPKLRINGHPELRLAGNLHFSACGVDFEIFMAKLRPLALSSTSACNMLSQAPSHVLSAMGIEGEANRNAVRIGLGRFTSLEDIEAAGDYIEAAYRASVLD